MSGPTSLGAVVGEAPSGTAGLGLVLRNRGFRLIWLAQACSQVGFTAVNFALIVQIEIATHSSMAVSLLAIAFSLPAVLFAGLAGVLADRRRKRPIMVVTTGLRAAVLAGLVAVDPDWPWLPLLAAVYITGLAFSTLSQFNGPAEAALIPRLVGQGLLVPANSFFNLTFFAAQLAGFAVVGPVLVKLVGPRPLFAVAAALFAASTALVARLPRDEPAPAASRQWRDGLVRLIWDDLRDGLVIIRADPLLVKAIGYLALASAALLMLGTLGPAFVTRSLRAGAADLGLLLAPVGLGLLAGIVLVNRWARPDNRERMIDRAIITWGGATLALALVAPAANALAVRAGIDMPEALVFAVVVALAVILGGSTAYLLVPSQTLLQEQAAEPVRARAYAALSTVSNAASAAPVLVAGAISDLANITVALVGTGLTLVVAGVITTHHASRIS